jgi:hypothetical protein
VLKYLRAALRAVAKACGSYQSPDLELPLSPAVQAAASPVMIAPLHEKLCERELNDNTLRSAPYAGRLSTCALFYHEFHKANTASAPKVRAVGTGH